MRGVNLAASPITSLIVIAMLTCVLIGSGSLNSLDTLNRLQVTHSLWTGQAQVIDDPDLGISTVGRDGKHFANWGIGQSLVMLPADVIGDQLVSLLPTRRANSDVRDLVRVAIVSYVTFTIVNTISIVLAYLLLLALDFSELQARLGTLTLLLGTSFLAYAQIHQENSLMLMCVLGAFVATLTAIRTHRTLPVFVAGSFLGLSLLIRLPGILDFLAVAAFGVLIVARARNAARETWARAVAPWLGGLALAYFPYVLLERAYQWLRFGSVTTTYTSIWSEQVHRLHRGLPAAFPFSTPFWQGFCGQLLAPDRSIFLFNPLLLLAIILCVRYWSRIGWPVKAFVGAGSFLLLADMALYATWFEWGGSGSWGPRYAVVPSEVLALLAVPLVMRLWPVITSSIESAVYRLLIAAGFVVALSAVIFDFNLEQYQERTVFHTTSLVVWQRLVNIFAIATGHFREWALMPIASPSQQIKFTSPAFMPWRTLGEIPHRISLILQVSWLLGLALLVALLTLFIGQSLQASAAYSRGSRGPAQPSTTG